MAQTIVEHHYERGKVQGIEQGMEEGKIQEKRAAVLKVLRLRFPTIPESIADGISVIQSLSRLDSLLEQAVTATTLDEIDLQNLNG